MYCTVLYYTVVSILSPTLIPTVFLIIVLILIFIVTLIIVLISSSSLWLRLQVNRKMPSARRTGPPLLHVAPDTAGLLSPGEGRRDTGSDSVTPPLQADTDSAEEADLEALSSHP